MHFVTHSLSSEYDEIAPDGSQIRLLAALKGGSMCYCTLPERHMSQAIYHRTVEEIWYFISGRGEIWRKLGDNEEITPVCAGVSLTIPTGTHFQFRNTDFVPLCFVISTIPPWPGPGEAVRTEGKWSVTP